MDRHKSYLFKLKNGEYMVAWKVKNEDEAIIICKAWIIRHNMKYDFEFEFVEEIQGLTDFKMVGVDDFILANN